MTDPTPSPSTSLSPSRTPKVPPRSGSFHGLTKRASAQGRIDKILETARERAESHHHNQAQATASSALTPGTPGSPFSGAPLRHSRSQPQTQPRMEPLLRNRTDPPRTAGADGDAPISEEDDVPALTMNYQGTADCAVSQRKRSSGSRRGRVGGGDGAADDGGVGLGIGAGGDTGRTRRRSSRRVTEDEDEKGWWRGFLAGFSSIELENKGSVARDHLALERTFLAWLRTSLAFASIGIAITQLFRLNTSSSNGGGGSSPGESGGGGSGSGGGGSSDNTIATLRQVGRPLGATFLGISILVLFLGYNRYHQSQQWIMRGKFPASRGTVLLVSLVAFALMIVSLIVVVVIHADPPTGK